MPVIDLAKYSGIAAQTPREIMIVTEYNGHTQGFLVEGVDTILRLDWSRSKMRVPPEMLTAQTGGLVTAVTELEDGRLVMMMDVEKVLSETTSIDNEIMFRGVVPLDRPDMTVFYCDDSSVARKQIERTLNVMGVKGLSAVNGRQMWEEMEKVATYAQTIGKPVAELINLVLTDYRNAGNGWLHPDQENQVRSPFQRDSGDHAFIPLGHVEPEVGHVGRCR